MLASKRCSETRSRKASCDGGTLTGPTAKAIWLCPEWWCRSVTSRQLKSSRQTAIGDRLMTTSIANCAERLQRQVAVGHRPLIILLKEQDAHKADDGDLIREDVNNVAAPLDLSVEPLVEIGTAQLRSVLCGETHKGKHVSLGIIHQRVQAWSVIRRHRARAVSESALAKGGANLSGNDTALRFAGVHHDIAHKMEAATLLHRVQHLGDSHPQPVMSIGDDKLHACKLRGRRRHKNLVQNRFSLAIAGDHAEHFTTAVSVHTDRDDDCDQDNMMVATSLGAFAIPGFTPTPPPPSPFSSSRSTILSYSRSRSPPLRRPRASDPAGRLGPPEHPSLPVRATDASICLPD